MPEPPMLIVDDDAVCSRVDQIAAAAQVRVDHCRGVPSAGAWRVAPLLVIDVAAVPDLLARGMARRDGIVVVSAAEMTGSQWQACWALGADHVLALGADDTRLTRLLADANAQHPLESTGRAIAVVGACGGAGATVFAIALAMTACKAESPVLLCDLDPFGAGVEVALGLEDAGGVRWRDIAASRGRLSADALQSALPSVPVATGAVSVLGYGREVTDGGTPTGPDRELVDAALDSMADVGGLAVVDVSYACGAIADQVVSRADRTILVTTADVRGCYAASRVAPALAQSGAALGLVVRGPSPGGIGADDVSAVAGIPLLAAMRPQPGLDRALEAGRGPSPRPRGPLMQAAGSVLREIENG